MSRGENGGPATALAAEPCARCGAAVVVGARPATSSPAASSPAASSSAASSSAVAFVLALRSAAALISKASLSAISSSAARASAEPTLAAPPFAALPFAALAAMIFAVAHVVAPPPASAETLVAARAIVGSAVVREGDLGRAQTAHPGALRDLANAVGKEARVTLYPGRPIMPGDLRPAALVERNDIVRLSFDRGGLTIRTEGRALDRGAAGERVRVMNLSSRTIVAGAVSGAGRVRVAR